MVVTTGPYRLWENESKLLLENNLPCSENDNQALVSLYLIIPGKSFSEENVFSYFKNSTRCLRKK